MPVRTIYIDVDNTLINREGTILPGVEPILKHWRRMYRTVIIWSHTGGDYAKDVCKRLKIDKYADYFLDKPDIIVDDDPDMILRYAHILTVSGMSWWQKAMDELFRKVVTKEETKK